MKHFLFALLLLLECRILYSQQKDSCEAGVYVAQDDFVNNRLSYKINTGVKGNKLEFTFPSDMTLAVKIITPDTTFKFAPGSIYGYNDCGKIFRYFEGGKELNAQEDYYQVEEAGGLILYSSAFVSDNETFYSKTLTSPIHRLVMENLKKDFKNHPQFIEAAKELNKKVGDGLATRDENGKYLINKIYQENIKSD